MLGDGSASASPPTIEYGVNMNRIVMLSLICAVACQTQPETTATPQTGSSDLFANQGGEGTTLATIGDQRLTVEAMEKKINAMTPFVVPGIRVPNDVASTRTPDSLTRARSTV